MFGDTIKKQIEGAVFEKIMNPDIKCTGRTFNEKEVAAIIGFVATIVGDPAPGNTQDMYMRAMKALNLPEPLNEFMMVRIAATRAALKEILTGGGSPRVPAVVGALLSAMRGGSPEPHNPMAKLEAIKQLLEMLPDEEDEEIDDEDDEEPEPDPEPTKEDEDETIDLDTILEKVGELIKKFRES